MLISTKRDFFMLTNVKMPTVVGILTFISMINTSSESLKARKVFTFQLMNFHEKLKFYAQLLNVKSFIVSGAIWVRFLPV